MRFRRFLILLAACLCLGCFAVAQTGSGSQRAVREPAVAGQFYPASAAALQQAIQAYLRDALPPKPERPVAMVVPHAGYVFSAQIAADAFRQAGAHKYDVVVIMGANHSAAGFDRIAILPGTGFRTPLGVVEIDRGVADSLIREDADCIFDQAAHAKEHSVEVQVPFVQQVFPGVKIVPVVVGVQDAAACIRFGRALAKVLKDRQPLIIASSDLSHYPSAREAPEVDRRTLEAIASLNPNTFRKEADAGMARGVPELVTTACGSAPIMAAMTAASGLGATRGVVVSYANSADVAVGDPRRVVGYGAVTFTTGERGTDTTALRKPMAAASTEPLDLADKQALLVLARETLNRFLTTDTLPLARGFSPRADRVQGAFVTLKKRGELRGCIGQIVGAAPLARVVSMMALEAALNDTRFDKVRASELASLEIEISALTPPKAVAGAHAVVVGRDGVILQKDGRSAVFLPQVATEQGWGREEMLDNLCQKGGLPAGCWKSGATLQTFQADVFSEHQFRDNKK
ncbi:MAG: AmmeMemoRadiSam system protein B [Acidobacteria bacterium]|nr:AmmeMemoRadiSam system protein B [Acidobacteriota bacterium]